MRLRSRRSATVPLRAATSAVNRARAALYADGRSRLTRCDARRMHDHARIARRPAEAALAEAERDVELAVQDQRRSRIGREGRAHVAPDELAQGHRAGLEAEARRRGSRSRSPVGSAAGTMIG